MTTAPDGPGIDPDHAPPPTEGSFPRQKARTRGFRLGAPRSFSPSPDGRRVVFLRSATGSDPVTRLWVLDVPAAGSADEATPRQVVDPVALLGDAAEDLPPEERARRERLREVTAGVTAYATDADVTVAAFALSGRPYVVDLTDPAAVPRLLPSPGPVVDPRPDPGGTRVAFAAGGGLHVVGADGAGLRALCEPVSDTESWGVADFVAAEEMDRLRGFWWSPTGDRLLVERHDDAPVATWWIADPSAPAARPRAHRYPAAGTDNADVSLWLVDLDGARREVEWDRESLPYLGRVHWSRHGPPLLAVQSRDQRRLATLAVDPDTGATRVLRQDEDPAWTELVAGTPQWTPDGRLVHTVDDGATQTRRLALDGVAVSPPGLQVRAVADVDAAGILLWASPDPTLAGPFEVGYDGEVTGEATRWSSARRAGDLTVVAATGLDRTSTTVTVRRDGDVVARIESYAEQPLVRPRVTVLSAGPRRVRTAVLWPRGHRPGSGRLPVLMSPYGGPGAQRVVASGLAFATEQWLADQGFCVVVADGAGTPGRGPGWEREVHHDLAGPVLEDQLAALDEVLAQHPQDTDPARVGIRGWSFGGYLAALAVLRRPDRFHVAVAGAPVTEWRLYDTHYTERYLGDPREDPGPYDACSLLPQADRLTRPLLLVHGLADDNVVVAHTLALSGALLAAGRPHTVLPLSGVTHMTPQEVVAENLLRLEVGFLADALGIAYSSATPTLT